VAYSQLALLYCLTQCSQLTLGLGGALGCLLAISLGFATGGLLAQGLGLQPCDQLALRFGFAACGQLGLLQGVSQRCKLSLSLGGGPGRLVAMSFSLVPGRLLAWGLLLQECSRLTLLCLDVALRFGCVFQLEPGVSPAGQLGLERLWNLLRFRRGLEEGRFDRDARGRRPERFTHALGRLNHRVETRRQPIISFSPKQRAQGGSPQAGDNR
jgi:hypothetical protein